MKKANSANSLFAILLAVIMSAAVLLLCGCSSGKEYDGAGFSGDVLPKAPSDPAVLEVWDKYELFNSVPRYTGGGLYDSVVETEGGGVNIYFNGASDSDFLDYNSSLKNSGFRLKDGSSVWAAEGSAGAPVYYKGDLQLTVVWTSDGMLAVCAARP